MLQPDGIDLVRETQEAREGLELAVDPGMDARVEEDDLAGQLAEEGLGGLAVGRPAGVDVGLPVPEPARQDEERAVLEEAVENFLVGEPFETLALLVETAGAFEPEVLGRAGQTVAADQADGAAVLAARGDGFAEAGPGRFDLVAVDGVEAEPDVLEIGRGLDGQDLSVEIRAGDQSRVDWPYRCVPCTLVNMSNYMNISIIA